MDQRLVAAEAALKAGRRGEAIDLLGEVLTESPDQPMHMYRVLILNLYQANRFAEGEAWSAKAVARFPREFELWNMRGVILRRLKRYPDALAALDQAQKLQPGAPAMLQNRGNVLLDMGDYARAEQVFIQLTRKEPRNPEYHRQLGRALRALGRREGAIARFRQAIALRKDYIDGWIDLAGTFNEQHRVKEAEEVLDRALEANPDQPKLLEAMGLVLRMAGHFQRAEAFLHGVAERLPNAAWVQAQLGNIISEYDRDRGNAYLRRAYELEPTTSHLIYLVQSLERTRTGDEGAHIEEAYHLAKTARPEGVYSPGQTKVLCDVFVRVADYDALASLGDFKTLGRSWAESDRHTALLKQMARVRTHEDKRELVEQHRIWGDAAVATAKAAPIKRPPPRAPDGRIRVGFMSSDLRQHPVAYFALPLFEHIDPRFDVYCYSFYQGKLDPLQQFISERVKAFRWEKDISVRDAAQMVADDQLDIFLELGGSTHMNKLEVTAYKPAPIQASWLGYPHSAGPSTIDYFVCDPYSAPTRADLMIEKPLMMPHTWLALGRAVFTDRHPIVETLPADRNGFITFGTANNPHKYSREVLRAWARVVAKVPDSKFAFIRPEGGTASFRQHILAEFAAEGVAGDRVIFHTVRGAHMPFYNELDITLDPFPLTGGTTTCEALWMGVPVVSLRGEAFYERLSYSILSNAGLGELCGETLDEYTEIALKLAADRDRRLDLRQTLRDRIRQSPLGQTEQFAHDFYDMLATAVQPQPTKATA